MKNFKNSLIDDYSSIDSRDNEIYTKYLYNKSFRGFYYDVNEKSYGIVLEFSPNHPESLTLFAQEAQSGSTVIEYAIHSHLFRIEQLAYDKILISAIECENELLFPEDTLLNIPKTVEFTIQVLTRHSIYLRFLNHTLYTPPISSFQGGLILSRDYVHHTHDLAGIATDKENKVK
jgi:hypothetical protein